MKSEKSKSWHRDRVTELESNKDKWTYARNIYVPGLIGFSTLFLYLFGQYTSQNNLSMMIMITIFGVLIWILLDKFYSHSEKQLNDINLQIEHNYDVLLDRDN